MVQFSHQVQEQLYSPLKGSFPDAKISDADMLALAICLQAERGRDEESLPAELRNIDLSAYSSELQEKAAKLPQQDQPLIARPSGDQGRYYMATAHHERSSPNGFKPFTGELAMARVTLTQRKPQVFHTALGSIDPADHLIDTVYEANQK